MNPLLTDLEARILEARRRALYAWLALLSALLVLCALVAGLIVSVAQTGAEQDAPPPIACLVEP